MPALARHLSHPVRFFSLLAYFSALIGMSLGCSSSSSGSAANGGAPAAQGGSTALHGGSPGSGGAPASGGKLGAGGAQGGASAQGGAASGGTAAGSANAGAAGQLAGGSNPGSGGSGNAGAGSTAGAAGSSSAGASGLCASAFVSTKASGMVAAEYQAWLKARVKDCSNGSAIVSNGGGVFSEGIGYGMLLTATHDDRTTFDKLWKFYTDHLDPNGLMNWQMGECDAPGNNNANAATDGDLDAAMGLQMADARWGGYQTQLLDLLHKIKEHETDSCSGLNVLRPGDKFGGCTDGGRVNPSYFAPGYYRAFAQVDAQNAEFWKKLADDSYTLLAQYQAKMNGLVPEWANVNGSTEGDYAYNACRTPWRVAVDYAWYCTPAAKTFLQAVSAYVDTKGGVASVPFDKNSAFLGAFALSAIPATQAKLDGYVDAWLGAKMDDTPYFQGTLRVLYLDVAAGVFRPGR